MNGPTAERRPGAAPIRANQAFGFAGFVLVALGVIGAVTIWADMTSTGFDQPEYSSAEIWSEVLSALVVAGLGLIIGGVGVILGRLPDRD